MQRDGKILGPFEPNLSIPSLSAEHLIGIPKGIAMMYQDVAQRAIEEYPTVFAGYIGQRIVLMDKKEMHVLVPQGSRGRILDALGKEEQNGDQVWKTNLNTPEKTRELLERAQLETSGEWCSVSLEILSVAKKRFKDAIRLGGVILPRKDQGPERVNAGNGSESERSFVERSQIIEEVTRELGITDLKLYDGEIDETKMQYRPIPGYEDEYLGHWIYEIPSKGLQIIGCNVSTEGTFAVFAVAQEDENLPDAELYRDTDMSKQILRQQMRAVPLKNHTTQIRRFRDQIRHLISSNNFLLALNQYDEDSIPPIYRKNSKERAALKHDMDLIIEKGMRKLGGNKYDLVRHIQPSHLQNWKFSGDELNQFREVGERGGRTPKTIIANHAKHMGISRISSDAQYGDRFDSAFSEAWRLAFGRFPSLNGRGSYEENARRLWPMPKGIHVKWEKIDGKNRPTGYKPPKANTGPPQIYGHVASEETRESDGSFVALHAQSLLDPALKPPPIRSTDDEPARYKTDKKGIDFAAYDAELSRKVSEILDSVMPVEI